MYREFYVDFFLSALYFTLFLFHSSLVCDFLKEIQYNYPWSPIGKVFFLSCLRFYFWFSAVRIWLNVLFFFTFDPAWHCLSSWMCRLLSIINSGKFSVIIASSHFHRQALMHCAIILILTDLSLSHPPCLPEPSTVPTVPHWLPTFLPYAVHWRKKKKWEKSRKEKVEKKKKNQQKRQKKKREEKI